MNEADKVLFNKTREPTERRVTEWDYSRRYRSLVGGADRCVVYCSALFKVTAHSDPNLVLQATENNASIASGFCNNCQDNTNKEILAQITNPNFLSYRFLVQWIYRWTVTLLSLLCLIIMNNVLFTHRFSVFHMSQTFQTSKNKNPNFQPYTNVYLLWLNYVLQSQFKSSLGYCIKHL